MTAFKVAEKHDCYAMSTPRDATTDTGECRRSVLIGLIASLSTALVLGSAFVGVIFYIQSEKGVVKPEWSSWIRVKEGLDIHESVLIDENEQTILMVSAEAYKVNFDNSLALHDFKTGFVALRDFVKNRCFVSNISNPDFWTAKTMLESRQGRRLPPQPVKNAQLRPGNMTSSELGTTLTKFCAGVPANWFDLIPGKARGMAKRQIISGPRTTTAHPWYPLPNGGMSCIRDDIRFFCVKTQ